MAQQGAVQDYIAFNNGWVAEGGPFAQVENAFLDGENIIVDPDDGSVYRRKGLVAATAIASTANTSYTVDAARWYNPGGDSDDLIVVKIAETLYFYEAGSHNLGSTKLASTVDLTAHKSDVATTDATIRSMRVSMVSGKGYMFVTGPYIESLYLSYASTTSTVTAAQITFYERDLEGSNRGATDADNRPTAFDDDHVYNLQNQGWPYEYIEKYYNAWGKYPSRAISPWEGLVEETSVYGNTQREFKPKLIRHEQFGTSEAARGHFILNVFDTETAVSSVGPSEITKIVLTVANSSANGDGSYTYDLTAKIWFPVYPTDISPTDTFTVSGAFNLSEDRNDYYSNGTTLAASVVNQTLTLGAFETSEEVPSGGPTAFRFTLGTVATSITSDTSGPTVNNGDTITFVSDNSQSAGEYVPAAGTTSTTVGVVEDRRFEHCTFYASRLWVSGCQPESRTALAGRIYYSQIIRDDYHIGRCYTQNDPTAKDFNDVLDTDGGYIDIPEMGVVKAMHTLAESVIIIADNGVWEIKSGEAGYFTPTGYATRRISQFGMPFVGGSVQVDGAILYWSEEGIKQISGDQITALSQNADVSGARIRTYVQTELDESTVNAVYDPYEAIAYWKFDRGSYTHVLALNLRIGAFYRWTFTNQNAATIKGIMVGQRDVDGSGNRVEDNLYFITSDADSYDYARLTGTDYIDSAVGEVADSDGKSYIETRNQFANDASRPKQAMKLVTYMEKDTGASAYAQGKYEWAGSGDSGKWNNKQQAYRDRGTGYDVAISRLVQRGWGRAFRVKWTSESEAPFRIYGYSLFMTGGSQP